MSKDKFENAVSAYEQVMQTVAALKSDHCAVVAEIAEAEEKLNALPLEYLPLDDLKAAILDFVSASGERYAKNKVRSAISSFATGGMRSLGNKFLTEHGKPLRYADIDGAISGEDGSQGRAQLLTPDKNAFDDQVLYFFFSQFVREGLREIMEGMAPEEFGYGAIHSSKIGSARAERRLAIEALNRRLEALRERKAEIEQKLSAIGAPVTSSPKGHA